MPLCRYYMAPDGLSLDVGPFTSALEYATGAAAVVLGKPASSVFHLAAQSLGLKPEQVVMVGDDVIGDVGGAQEAGCRGILVRTGKYRAGDEAGAVAPEAVLTSVALLPEWLAQQTS
jgi:HAD superfamily hydrolase (TIGR01458 family)